MCLAAAAPAWVGHPLIGAVFPPFWQATPACLLLLLLLAEAKPQHREENAVLQPGVAVLAARTSPQVAVQDMMMQAIKCCPVDEQRGMRRVFLSNRNVTCNDGSPAGFYIRRSHGSRKWIIFLEGGWYCYDTWSCHHRWLRLRHLMTSAQWPDVRHVGGILSQTPEENPYAWNANHVLVPYCSSDSWSGATPPGPAPDPSSATFSFMGSLIVQEVVRDLAAMGLHNDSHILLAGTSAGGTGVMLNVDAVQDLVRGPLGMPHVCVRGLVDSGWFLDRAPFSPDGPYGPNRPNALSASDAVRQGMSLWRARMPSACAAHHRAEPWRCYFGYRLYPTIRAPLFIFQWLFDEAQMTADNVGAPVTKQQWDFIHKMGDNFRTTFKNVSAVFAPSCIAHTVLTKRDWASVRIDRVSLPSALRCWESRHLGPHLQHLPPSSMVSDSPVGEKPPEEKHKRKKGSTRKQRKGQGEGRARSARSARSGCPTRHVEMCSWPQCNHSCPKLHNPFTGEEMDFIELLKSFGLDMMSVANALGIDIQTLNNMDHEELLNLLTQQANCRPRPARVLLAFCPRPRTRPGSAVVEPGVRGDRPSPPPAPPNRGLVRGSRTMTARWTLSLLLGAVLFVHLEGQPMPSSGSKPVSPGSSASSADSSSDEVDRYPGEVLGWKNTLMATRDDADDNRCFALLYMTVSPLLEPEVPPRLTDVAWDYSHCNATPRRVVLYERQWDERDAASVEEIVAVWSAEILEPKGRIRSNYSAPRGPVPYYWQRNYTGDHHPDGDFCLPFRAALLDEKARIINTQCIRMRPTWMKQLVDKTNSELSIHEMLLPGTHNSFCYSRDRDSESSSYLLTQDLDVWDQLLLGVRYFDIRVGYYPQDMGDQQNEDHPDHGEKFWVNHGIIRVQPLVPLLRELRRFLTDFAKHEMVVLDFHRFPVGFGASSGEYDDPHPQLIEIIKQELGDILVTNDRPVTMPSVKDTVAKGKKVLVAYHDKKWQSREINTLWQPIPQQWGNQQSPKGLMKYLDKAIHLVYQKHYEVWALMAEMTPTVVDVLMQRSNLRVMADLVNYNVTERARRGYWYRNANVIAPDFIEGTDLVRVAVESCRFRTNIKKIDRLPVSALEEVRDNLDNEKYALPAPWGVTYPIPAPASQHLKRTTAAAAA
ncbi:uncharacterized protein LOC117652715 [Thrips palmi]|uniref:Uncharacterized protein LOC117652715 n=1 Tax=Thrips palmi TaxID=161013 RepID=A0A6P9A8V4_THRPL|nr:uncharacterized protein LOC117652715 [Thrips palmi]